MNNHYFIGIDVGGTKIEGSLAKLNVKKNEIENICTYRLTNEYEKSKLGVLSAISSIVEMLIKKSQLSLTEIKALGLGLPGSLHQKTRVMLNGNTQYLIGINLIEELNEIFNHSFPIYAQNDANCFVLAEAWSGVGKIYFNESGIGFNQQVALGVTLGTGVGGGLISKGELFEGAHGSALEVGHFSIKENGIDCYCKNRGCAELYLSGTGINKFHPSHDLIKLWNQNDPKGISFFTQYRKDLLTFLTTLNNLFNPHYFVFGGGLSNEKRLFEKLEDELSEKIFLSKNYSPKIYVNQLGDSAGVYGAMIYANNQIDH
jgi:predicted NBD/HSP70 family sugar kinase